MVDIWDGLDERTRNEMELEKRHPAPREAVAELVEAAKDLLESCRTYRVGGAGDHQSYSECRAEDLRTALARVEGEPPSTGAGKGE